MSVLLDSTILIDAVRGRPVAERIRRMYGTGQVPWICAINVEEVCRGMRPSEEQAVGRLLSGLRMAPLGQREGGQAAAWRRSFAERGVTLAQSDCLIAAAALGVGARLATGNPKDFPMPELGVDHWPVGA